MNGPKYLFCSKHQLLGHLVSAPLVFFYVFSLMPLLSFLTAPVSSESPGLSVSWTLFLSLDFLTLTVSAWTGVEP